MRRRPTPLPVFGLMLLIAVSRPALLRVSRPRRPRRPHSYGRELQKYRRELTDRTIPIDAQLTSLGDLVDALRRKDADVDDALVKLMAGEEFLDKAAEGLRGILAPEELHALHAEYEGNLERALRGIVTAERGCGITTMRHRPPEDAEPMIYWKRGHLNILHARLKMRELVEALMNWEPGMPAEATIAARQGRP